MFYYLTNRRNGWQGPEGQQQDNYGGAGGGNPGWNDDKGNSWGEPQMHQNNSWGGKPKTPTNPNAGGWGDDSLVDTTSWGGPPKNTVSICLIPNQFVLAIILSNLSFLKTINVGFSLLSSVFIHLSL